MNTTDYLVIMAHVRWNKQYMTQELLEIGKMRKYEDISDFDKGTAS